MNIKDIAEIAGVSTSTVSKVLNKKDENISEQTRKKVLDVVKEYQYVPYSKVKNRKTHLVGLLIDKVYLEYDYSYLIEKEMTNYGYSVLLNYIDNDRQHLMKALRILKNKQVEGIMLLTDEKNTRIVEKYCDTNDIALVVLNNEKTENSYSVFNDQKSAGLIATNYLLDLNHSNIAFIGIKSSSESFISGYNESYFNHNKLISDDWIYLFSNLESIEKFELENIINRDVSALICGDSDIALILVRKLKQYGLLIPDDISIISLVDHKKNLYSTPLVSGVAMNEVGIVKQSAQLLVKKIEGKNNELDKNHAIKPRLVIRDSVGVPAKQHIVNVSKIVTVGSMNMDITIKTEGILKSGVTTIAQDTYHIPGGKGANQAIGASRLGALSYLIGCLGNDVDGRKIYTSLQESSVKTDGVHIDSNLASGKAYINVFNEGESAIAIYAGANKLLNKDLILKNISLFDGANFCLLSTEIPREAILETINICSSKKINIIMKPSAEFDLDNQVLKQVDYLIPNEKEVNKLVNHLYDIKSQAEYLYNLGVKNVIITLGSKGAYLKNDKYELEIPAADFIPLDTTGAADAFVSALAVYLSEGNDILTAISFAIYNAGLSTTELGAQPALPNRVKLDLYKNDIVKLKDYLEGKAK